MTSEARSAAGSGVAPEEFAHWSEEGVRVGDVSAALDRLRSEHRRAATVTRVVNLVVVSGGAAEAHGAAAVTRTLNALHPGRTIVLDCAAGRPPGIDAEVSLYQSVAGGEEVWWEEVRLRVGGPACGHLDSLVAPLVLSDVPLVAWYTAGVPTVSDRLARSAPVVVIDSEQAVEAGDSPQALLHDVSGLLERRSVVDLAWVRTSAWRRLAAELFSPGRLRPFVRGVDGARVHGPEMASRLLAGWLVDRLGPGAPEAERSRAGELSIELLAHGAGRPGRFSLEQRGGSLTGRAEVSGRQRLSMTVRLPDDLLAWSVSEALTHLGGDELYGAAVRAA